MKIGVIAALAQEEKFIPFAGKKKEDKVPPERRLEAQVRGKVHSTVTSYCLSFHIYL